MMQPPPVNILRNTATLEAWRAYSRKANGPLFAALFATTFFSAATPAMIVLLRHRGQIWVPFVVFLVCEVVVLGGLIVAALKVRAYKRAHPFVPPPPVVWSEKR